MVKTEYVPIKFLISGSILSEKVLLVESMTFLSYEYYDLIINCSQFRPWEHWNHIRAF
jgi:hypothetical protein